MLVAGTYLELQARHVPKYLINCRLTSKNTSFKILLLYQRLFYLLSTVLTDYNLECRHHLIFLGKNTSHKVL